MGRLLTAFSALLVSLGAAGCQSGVFTCESDTQCGADGRCEFDGYCSFPDGACDSGRRYGRHATNELVNACVDEVMSTDVSTGAMGSASGSVTTELSSSSMPPLTSSETGEASTTEDDSTSSGAGTTTDETEAMASTTEPPPSSLTLWVQCDDFTDVPPDASAESHSAECTNCPTESTSFSGGSCRFEDPSGPVQYFGNGSEFESESFTVMAWVQRVDIGPNDCGTIASKESQQPDRYSWKIGLCRSGMDTIGLFGAVCPTDEGMNCHQGLRTVFDLNREARWHHVAFTHSDTEAVLYHDGVAVFPFTGRPVAYDGSPIYVGGDDGDGPVASGGPFLGDIDELKVFDVVLSEQEIFEIYSARAP